VSDKRPLVVCRFRVGRPRAEVNNPATRLKAHFGGATSHRAPAIVLGKRRKVPSWHRPTGLRALLAPEAFYFIEHLTPKTIYATNRITLGKNHGIAVTVGYDGCGRGGSERGLLLPAKGALAHNKVLP